MHRSQAVSFDHLVGSLKERFRDRKAECLRGLEVDDQLELGRLLHGQVSGLGSLEYPVDIADCPAQDVAVVCCIRHQAAGLRYVAPREQAGQPPRQKKSATSRLLTKCAPFL